MSSIKFDVKTFTKENPEATKEELIAAIHAAPEVIGITQFEIFEYLMEEDRNREYEVPDADELEALLPVIVANLRHSLISWESIDEAYENAV